MQTLSGFDATLLALDTPTANLHVTGVLVFDPDTMPGGYSFGRAKEILAARLHRAPPLRRRLMTVPFGIGRPVWVDDPDFDLDYHVRRAALPDPGGAEELAGFAADVASRPLDRSKPLWEMWFVERVEGGNVALVAKMHHATIDGVTGANLMAELLDVEAAVAEEPPPSVEWRPEQPPSDAQLLIRAVAGRARRRLQLPRTIMTTVRGFGRLLTRRLTGAGGRMATPFSAPPTVFNQSITPHRRVELTLVPLGAMRQVKDAFGVTINDVVLALCGGALRRYLLSLGELPDDPLVAAVPMAVGGASADERRVNQLSGMLVSLATDIPDAAQRLSRITDATRGAKEEHRVLGDELLPELGEFAATNVFGLGARLYSQLGLASRHRPALNVIVSNIPGPDFPLYFAGAKLLALYPLGPVYDGVGLNITVLSYLDGVGFGFVACSELVPDLEQLAGAVSEELQALEKEAGSRRPDHEATGR
jgi:diacylglycerol O-acyltransferase / wax synthase